MNPDILFHIKLDIIKSIPEFNGSQDDYLAWRLCAMDAYKLLKSFITNSAYNEGVTLIKERIRGLA